MKRIFSLNIRNLHHFSVKSPWNIFCIQCNPTSKCLQCRFVYQSWPVVCKWVYDIRCISPKYPSYTKKNEVHIIQLGGSIFKNRISYFGYLLQFRIWSDMGGWVGEKWAKKSDIICGWPLMQILYSRLIISWNGFHCRHAFLIAWSSTLLLLH